MTSHETQEKARSQINQCPSCGAFRLDGGMPVLHRQGCTIAEAFRWHDPDLYPMSKE